MTEQLAEIPLPGESFDYNGMHIAVTRSTPKRVAEIQITINPEQ